MSDIQTMRKWLLSASEWIFIVLLAYMPIHIFVSTWIGSSFGILEITRVAKDIVMILGFGLALLGGLTKQYMLYFIKQKLVLLILTYSLLTSVIALLRPTDLDAEILGVVYNTRFLLFFVYALLLVTTTQNIQSLRKKSIMAVLCSALVVLLFGVLQYAVISDNALSHVGYQRSNGVLPVFFIDDKPDLERIMSTLRDPNSLGSYVIIILSIAAALWFARPKLRRVSGGFLVLSIMCLWFSFSRSAWIGALVSGVVILLLHSKGRLKQYTNHCSLIIFVALSIVFAAVLITARDSYFVQNVIFHADESTVLEDPNELRVRFWKESVQDVAQDPLGSGPGTAGLASIRNNKQGTELNENYYLQIASEVGIVGIVLFLAILVLVALRLYGLQQKDWLALALFGSFAGLFVTNFLVHIWSNEAVAYTWWGLAGLVAGLLRSKQPRNQKKATVQK